MRRSPQKALTLVAVLGTAWWLFGNLYESIVFSPNWVEDSPAQMRRLHEFFTHTGPTLYFVPLTQLATLLAWVLLWRNRDDAARPFYRRAGLWAVALTAVNAYIVAVVVPKLFGANYLSQAERLTSYCWQWNILNVLRMALTATTMAYLFNAYRVLDRAREA